ncbi:Armadillo-type fold [Pseudocohnilembus persalinus]|uniref:LisH domain-containing protein ARMC9 n=1 Tax=Pseudocohnilembus persalinus TaxID=266149 RepID=A0A0V0R9J9_PSEPJ|nr:Armadillo-type fold [Pseudocohnilembus persalinus]|eukprot:KRX11161.1 Armadillo-type fold [Pseudocohnilembus persalinus]
MYKNPTQTRQQLLQSANNSKRQYQSQQGNPNNINNKNQKINEQSQKTNKRNSNPNPNQSQELQGLNSKLNQKNTTSNPSQYTGKRLQSAQVNRTTDQKDQHQEAVFNIIHEYLAKKGLTKTLESFENEINNQSQLQTQELHDQQIKQEKLIEAFNSGNREQFFKIWAQIVPTNTRQNNDQCSKLEFYLNIYFFVYNIHPFCGTSKKPSQIPKQNVEQFKLYLENRGKDLSKTSEFLQYYALPYIDKPQKHTALKHIFTQEWVQEIQEKLAHFLKSFYPSEQQPLLYQMYQAFVKQNLKQDIDDVSLLNLEKLHLEQKKSFMDQSQLEQMQKSEIAQLKNDNQELMSLLQELNQKHQTLLQRYKEDKEQVKNSIFESQKKWVQVSQDLVIISKNAQGVKFSENQIASYTKKILKFENTLSTNIEELISQSQDQSIFDKVSQTEIDNSVIPQQKMEQQPYKQEKEQFYTPLNFAKIKEVFLRAQEPILICAILQALKWRITKSRGAYVRREVVISYATFDILGCKNLGLQQELLMGDKKVQEFTLRLINSMASDYHGRSYLVESDELVKRLINILRIEHEDTPIRRNALGSLQKLSLRRRPQIVMIQNDLIQWIVDTLRDQKDTLSEYSYEYATALFMNLSLRSLGKNKCEDQHFMKDVLEVLNALLEHENTQVRTFVNGTLYSLLSRQIIREQAISMGFNDILNFLMENSDDRFTKQIQYIIDQLNRDSTDEEIQSDNEEDNDVDDIEDEEDLGEEEETDELINVDNILLGEELLINQYALQGQEAIDLAHQIYNQ